MKLTGDDIILEFPSMLKIDCAKLNKASSTIKTQILENQEKAKFWDKIYDELVTDECEVDNNSMAFFCLKEDLQKLESYKQKLEKVDELADPDKFEYSVDLYDFITKLKKILEEK